MAAQNLPLLHISCQPPEELTALARCFDVHYEGVREQRAHFRVQDKQGLREFSVPAPWATARLTMELCAKTTRWVCYRPGVHCLDLLLSHPPEQLRRLTELYEIWKSQGFPEQ